MAKVVMPLLGISASGQFGKTAVFFPWKGLNCARMYVIPANPQTDGQQAQRAKMTSANDDFHSGNLTAVDITNWRNLAAIAPSPRTYFNSFTEKHIKASIAGEGWLTFRDDLTDSDAAGQIAFSVKTTTGKTILARYGTSPSYMPNVTTSFTDTAGTYTKTVSSLSEGVKYYYQFYESGKTYVVSGIGSVVTDVT
jgi:hypothetical protein